MSEEKVRNPDILIITLMRYFLETATKLSLEKLKEVGHNKEFCELMQSAAFRNITDEQIEYVMLFYSLRPDELEEDLDRMISTIRNMVDKALKGA